MTPLTRLHIHLTEPQRAALERLSRKTGLSVAELVRRAIDAYLEERKP